MMDGVTNREDATNSVIESPSVDAIQEFKAETGIFTAENQAAGLFINVVTRSGTNSLHGAAFDYLRNQIVDASGFFPTSDRAVPALRRNQFGFAVGGPFVKNKDFWFANYEGERQTLGSVLLGIVPTPAQISGTEIGPIVDPFTGVPFPNNQIPASMINPVLQKILSFYPAPNVSEGVYNYLNITPSTATSDRFMIKTDHYFSANDNVSVRFSFQNGTSFVGGIIPGLSGESTPNDTRGLAINYHHTFRPNLLNTATLGFSRWLLNFVAQAAGSKYAVNPGILGIGLAVGATNPVSSAFNVETPRHTVHYRPASLTFKSSIIIS